MEIELGLSAPSGPPDPIKPAPEFYGEMLLDAGRTAEAIAALEVSLTTHAEPHALGESHGEGARRRHLDALIERRTVNHSIVV